MRKQLEICELKVEELKEIDKGLREGYIIEKEHISIQVKPYEFLNEPFEGQDINEREEINDNDEILEDIGRLEKEKI